MTCRDVVDRLGDELTRELRGPERRHLRRHLASCPDCRVIRETYGRTIQLGRAALLAQPPLKPPEDLVAAILRAGTAC